MKHEYDIVVVGGVAANQKIRKSLNEKYDVFYPPLSMCGDNAAMIALACHRKKINQIKPDYFFKPNPRLSLKNSNTI